MTKRKKEIIAWMAFSGDSPAEFVSEHPAFMDGYRVARTRKGLPEEYKPVKVKITVME